MRKCPILASLNNIGFTQAATTEEVIIAITQLFVYCATNPNLIIRFTRSEIIIRIHSDTSYLSITKAWSRATGFFYVSDDSETPPLNGTIYVVCTILKNDMAFAAKLETGVVFVNCNENIVIRQTLIEMGHPQPATPINVDNKCAVGIVNEIFRHAFPLDTRSR